MKKTYTTPSLYDANGDLNKKWYVHYYDNGKRIRIYTSINRHKSGKERREAAQLIIDEIILKQKLTYKSRTRRTVEEYLNHKKNFLRPKSYQDHKSKVTAFFNFLGFDEFNNQSVRNFFHKLMASKSPTTYNNYRVVLRQLFRESMQLTSEELEELFNGINSVKAISVPPTPFSLSTIQQLKQCILTHCPSLWLVCQLQYYCFIRPNEIRNLKVADIILEESKIMVHASFSKNKKTRYPVIPPVFYDELKKEIKSRVLGEYLCPSSKGIFIQAGKNTYRFQHHRILERLGIPKSRYKLYSWKPTGMLHAKKNGASMKFLKEQAGHYSIDQTDSYLRSVGWRDDDNSSKLFPKI